MKSFIVLSVLGFGLIQFHVAANDIPKRCTVNEECVIDLPGMMCADGTPAYYSLTLRKDATKLLIFMQGGGACWDSRTCGLGMAKLSRPETGVDFTTGRGIFNTKDSNNPFASGYNIAFIPYCTADVFTGNKTNNYGTPAKPKIIRHMGYENVLKIFSELKKNFSAPDKVTLLGVSAGGIGAYYHMRTLVQTFPQAEKFVISDAGTPFEPPFVNKDKYLKITATWGAKDTLPRDFRGRPANNFGEMIEYNRIHFPEVRFGLISSYRDYIMTFFSFTIGSASPKTAVYNILQDVADNRLGANSPHGKVYYLNESNHDYTTKVDLAETISQNQSLATWLNSMLSEDAKGWDNIRPENVPDSLNEGNDFPRTMEELKAYELK